MTAVLEPVTLDEGIAAVRAVIAGRETIVYEKVTVDGDPECVYFEGGEPSCVIGHALVRLGRWTLDRLRYLDHGAAGGSVAAVDLPRYLPGLPAEVAVVFNAVQKAQDDGVPWGVALRRGELRYRSLKTDRA